MNYKYIMDQESLDEAVKHLNTLSILAWDTETGPRPEYELEFKENKKIGLDPYRSRIVTHQLGDEDIQYIIDNRCDLDMSGIYDILKNPNIVKVGINLRFDVKFILVHTGIVPKNLADCMIMEQNIRAGLFPARHDNAMQEMGSTLIRKYTSMASLVKFYLDLEIDKDHDLRTGLWKTAPGKFSGRQLEYMAGDCVYPMQIIKFQKKLIVDRGLQGVINLENGLIPVVADMEVVGCPFNVDHWLELLQTTKDELFEAEEWLNTYFENDAIVQEDLFGSPKITNKINFGSTKELAKLLVSRGYKQFTYGPGKYTSTASDKLKLMKIEGTLPEDLVDNIINYKQASKKVTAYGKNFMKSVNPVTSRIHPNFTQCLLVTGRMSCSPGMQTIPRDSEYRHAFNSPKGYKLIILDASQIEPRLSADLTNDRPAIEVFLRDGDIYTEDGEKMFNTKIIRGTERGDALRSRAKVAWLGLSYGQGKRKFHDYCRVFLGEQIFREETDDLYDKFFEIHWRMKEVMDEWSDQVDPALDNDYYIDELAKRFIKTDDQSFYSLAKSLSRKFKGNMEKGESLARSLIARGTEVTYVGTNLGRKRFFRKDFLGWWTAGRNAKIQGSAADIQKATMLAYQEYHWDNDIDAHIINVVHDEIITLVREDQAEDLYHEQIRLGEEVGNKFLREVPMKLEGGISDVWKKF